MRSEWVKILSMVDPQPEILYDLFLKNISFRENFVYLFRHHDSLQQRLINDPKLRPWIHRQIDNDALFFQPQRKNTNLTRYMIPDQLRHVQFAIWATERLKTILNDDCVWHIRKFIWQSFLETMHVDRDKVYRDNQMFRCFDFTAPDWTARS